MNVMRLLPPSILTLVLSAALSSGTFGMPLPTAGNWELAASQKLAASQIEEDALQPEDFVPPNLHEMSEEDFAQAYEEAMNDPLWYAADGERYEALFVTSDGVTYGRRGAAPNLPAPTKKDSFGAFEGGSGDAALKPPWDLQWIFPRRPPRRSTTSLRTYVGTDYWNDDRLRVPGTDQLTSYPYRVVGALSGSGSVSAGGCSGAKVGPRAVLTASHCVQSQTGPLRTSGKFNPGQNSTTALNGSKTWSGLYWRDWRIDRKYDYAVLFLADSQATVNLGWMGIVWWNDAASYDLRLANNIGYPCGLNGPNNCGQITSQRCDDSPRVDKRCDGWMYTDSAYLSDHSYRNDDLLEFYNDISLGHSGSPVHTSGNNVMAVAAACGNNTPGNVCYGPRFRQSMWNDVCGWIAAVPSAYGEHSLCN